MLPPFNPKEIVVMKLIVNNKKMQSVQARAEMKRLRPEATHKQLKVLIADALKNKPYYCHEFVLEAEQVSK